MKLHFSYILLCAQRLLGIDVLQIRTDKTLFLIIKVAQNGYTVLLFFFFNIYLRAITVEGQ